MKSTGICPKCKGDQVMHLHRVADAGDWSGGGEGGLGARTGSYMVPRSVLMRRTVGRGLLGGTSEDYSSAGETEGYVCAMCGYLEEYLKSPQSIDWSTIEGATRHTPERQPPYR